MPLKMTIASAVGVAAVAAATLMAPAMAANSSTQKACPSFTDSHRPGKVITSQLGTKGGFTCASGKLSKYVEMGALGAGIGIHFLKELLVLFQSWRPSQNFSRAPAPQVRASCALPTGI